jgi:general stress protein YciG
VGLVEVIEVEDEITLGGGVEAEVAQVRVAADDRVDPGGGQVGEVLSHDRGSAAKEGVRGGDHSANPDRDQPIQSTFVSCNDLLYRVGTAAGRAPSAQR